jgi:ATP-binding cassette subfamily F protein 3
VLTPTEGVRELGINARCGYYSQNRVEMLRMDRTVLQEALDTEQRVTEQFVRTLLGCFLFSGDAVDKPVKVLSGGEKSRLALVKLLIDPPNFLLMDEPTTHLDMASIEALVTALKQFEGTLVFISHDVYFIKQLAQQVIHVEGGRLRSFAGDYNYYVEKTGWGTATSFNTPDTAPAPKKAAPVGPSKEQRRVEAEQRQARARARKDQQNIVSGIEKRISEREARQEEIHVTLQDPVTYANNALFAELNRELKSISTELDRLHSEWEREATKLEKFA